MVSSRTSSANVTSTVNGSGVADGAGSASREDEGRAANGAGPREWNRSGPPSLSMSVDLHNLVSSNLTDSGRYSASPEDDRRAATTGAAIKIGCHDEEESYEGFGSVEGDSVDVDDGPESPGGSSSAPSPTGTNSRRNPRSPNSTVGRHSWQRTSLRRTPPCSGKKRLSSNALASQLYRSGSFNSSGIGSNYDPADDVFSDVSLEDVMDLSHKTAWTGTATRDATQNCPVESLRRAERNGDHGPSREGRGASSSLTDTVTRTFVNPVYEDDRDGSENEEENEDARSEIARDTERYRSVHRYFHFER